MNKTLRTILIVISVVAVLSAAVLVPWEEIAYKIGFDPLRRNTPSALKANCLVGKCNVYIDGQKKGETPLDILDIAPGEHIVKIERISDHDDFYADIEKKVEFIRGTEVLFEWELGPSEIYSQGHILSLESRVNDTKPVLSISSQQKDLKVAIDGVAVGSVPFLADTELLSEGEHKITVSKSGYLDQEVPVEVDYRYTSVIEVSLMAKPIEF